MYKQCGKIPNYIVVHSPGGPGELHSYMAINRDHTGSGGSATWPEWFKQTLLYHHRVCRMLESISLDFLKLGFSLYVLINGRHICGVSLANLNI